MRRLANLVKRLNDRRRAADGQRESDRPQNVAHRIRGWFFYCVYLMAAVAGIWFVLEAILLLAFIVTGGKSLTTLESDPYFAIRLYPEYPADPQSYTKVAIFGGSTAAGDHSTRPFSEIVRYDLQRRFPNRKIFVKNYATPGSPFHRHQAEYVKLLIDKYDVFIIYCGNNEAENWFDDSGYWRQPEYKNAKELVFRRPVEARSRVLSVLEKNSRIFALITRAKTKVEQIEAPITKNISANYQEIEPRDALPSEERKALVANFERDITEICELAQAHNKTVLLSVTATNEMWPPCCSFLRSDIGDDEKETWHNAFAAGMSAFRDEDYAAARKAFQPAIDIDPGVAIVNHRIGQCLLKLGEFEEGRIHLRRAIDQDGFYSRSVSELHDKARQLSDEIDCLHYVDCVAKIHQALRGGLADDEIFSDHCHMRLLGHVIVGRTFVNHLLRVEPFLSWGGSLAGDSNNIDWKSLGRQYHQALGVTQSDEAMLALGCVNYFFNMTHWTAYLEACYDQIDHQLRIFERINNRSKEAYVIGRLTRARMSVGRKELAAAAKFLNQALAASPAALDELMKMTAWNRYIREEFESAGIRFDADKRKYVATEVSGETTTEDAGRKESTPRP